MKRCVTILATLLLLTMAGGALAADYYTYGWSVSASNADPNVNVTADTFGGPVFVWYNCNGAKDGMAAAEFHVEVTGGNLFGFSAQNGFLLAPATDPADALLAVGSCPGGPVLAFQIFLSQITNGSVCLVPSTNNSDNVTVDCRPAPEKHDNTVVGLKVGANVCPDDPLLCPPSPVEDSSWGSIKALYR